MPAQIDPLMQALIQKALANPPAQQMPAGLPAHPNVLGQAGLYADKDVDPRLVANRNWFLKAAQGITDPAELDRLYQISKGPSNAANVPTGRLPVR